MPSAGKGTTVLNCMSVIYVSDPSSIASRYLPDPVTEESLREWIDEVAAAGIDLFIQEAYSQGWTTYWRTEDFEYDLRPQHRRFLPLLDSGRQPLGILLEQCRAHGIRFSAGFRMNDNHGAVSTAQGVGAGAGFIVDNRHLWLQERPPGPAYAESSPLDFSHEEVRAFLLSVVTRLVEKFDVDGIEICYRDQQYFPPGTGRDRKDKMTDLVSQIRSMLDAEGERRGADRRLLLGAHVFATIEECEDLGLDVSAWVQDGLVDYLSPADCMYAEFNLPYDEWGSLTSDTPCQLYPSIMPWTGVIARRRFSQEPFDQDQQRALAHTMYAQGADGVSLYNHFEVMHANAGAHAPFYPLSLHDSHHIRSDDCARNGRRHYVFDTAWGGFSGFLKDRTSTGAVKAQRAILDRPDTHAEYSFRLYEDFENIAFAQLLFRAYHLTMSDQLSITLNGKPVSTKGLRRRDDEARADHRPEDPAKVGDVAFGNTSIEYARESMFCEQRPYVTYWFPLKAELCVPGVNRLGLEMIFSDPTVTESVVVEEVEVFIVPSSSKTISDPLQ